MSIDFDAVKALAEPQLKLWEQAIQAKVISEEEGNRRKGESLQAAMEELNRKEELKKGKSSEEFTAAYIDRNPWVKELLNTRDMWKRHHEAVQSDAEAWEARVRDNYLARAKSGALSPLLTLIGVPALRRGQGDWSPASP
eukprot:gene7127-biopygen4388